MGFHIEDVNTEAACDEDNFGLYASVDPPTLRLAFIFSISLSLTLSFFYGIGRRGWNLSPDCATAKYELRYYYFL